jgi:hypothetical protein
VSDDEHEPQPPDPAGTQPKVDRDALLPARIVPPEAEDEQRSRDAAPLPEPVEGFAVVGEARDLHEPPHAARFQFILGALLAVGAMAVALLIWAVGQTGGSDGPAWSPWKPAGNGLEAAQEIAAHVGPQYKANGKQLTLVTASELEVGDIGLELVERQSAADGGELSRLEGDAVLFRLCGMDPKCVIRGKPTAERGLLLRREAVELAAYAFRYLPNLEYTVLFMPPVSVEVGGEGEKKDTVRLGNQTLVFRRGDLEPVLDAPLRATLKAPPPPVTAIRRAPERALVQSLATQRMFFYSFSQGEGDDHAFLVLDKRPTAEQIEAAVQQEALDATMEKTTGAAGP